MDGQGGGIGATIIKLLRQTLGERLEILAVGANSVATSRMMKAGANKGATGENAVVTTSRRVDVIMGPLGILLADAMMGEITPRMAAAVAGSNSRKIVIPLTQEEVTIVGASSEPLPHLVMRAIDTIREMVENV